MKFKSIVAVVFTTLAISAQANIIESLVNNKLFVVSPADGQIRVLIDANGASPIKSTQIKKIQGYIIESFKGELFIVNPADGRVRIIKDVDGRSPIKFSEIILH